MYIPPEASFIPTEAEIAAGCAEVRASWSPRERRERTPGALDRVSLTECATPTALGSPRWHEQPGDSSAMLAEQEYWQHQIGQ